MVRQFATLCVGILLWAAGAIGGAPTPAATSRPADPRNLGRKCKVRLVYFVASDRQPTAAWREKIGVVMAFVNDLYVTSLRDAGCSTRGLDFEFDGGGALQVHLVKGKHEAAHYTKAPHYDAMNQWRTILPEVRDAVGPLPERLHVLFAETYDSGPNPFEWPGGVALGAMFGPEGGVGLFSAWILRDELCATTIDGQLKYLADTTPIAGRKALGCPRGDSPRFEFIEDGVGAVAHEIGHALALWHDHRRDDVYIMGNGFRALRQNYLPELKGRPRVCFSPESNRVLAWSRLLGENLDASDTQPPEVTVTWPGTLPLGARRIDLAATIRDDKALGAAICFCSAGDSVVWGKELSGTSASVRFSFVIPPAKAGKLRLHFGVIDRGGNFTRRNATVDVGEARPTTTTTKTTKTTEGG